MGKKQTIRVGDQVRIVTSRFVLRVGYPLVFIDLLSEFDNHPKLEEALRMLGVMSEHNALNGYARGEAVRGLAKAAVRFRGWGGKERRIIYDERAPDRTGCVTTVISRRVRNTGDYFPPWGGQNYEGEWDYEPGGLTNQKAHVLLMTELGEIEAINVERVS